MMASSSTNRRPHLVDGTLAVAAGVGIVTLALFTLAIPHPGARRDTARWPSKRLTSWPRSESTRRREAPERREGAMSQSMPVSHQPTGDETCAAQARRSSGRHRAGSSREAGSSSRPLAQATSESLGSTKSCASRLCSNRSRRRRPQGLRPRSSAATFATVDKPTLLVAASESPPPQREMTAAMADALPNARATLVAGGHLIDPAAPEVLAFVEQVLERR
jgi:pimeloyl-ACP methyl ester carboxylesterase